MDILNEKIKQKFLKINNIPVILWGEKSNKIIIAVHGMMSNKADVPIEILAKNSQKYGYQVLSFDLPKHGERKEEKTLLNPQNCIEELKIIYDEIQKNWEEVSLFANSLGAYFSLLAYKDKKIEKAFFLSPLVDMRELIENMMKAFEITEEKLKNEKEILTPIGETLSWDYYLYVKENPIIKWETFTYILCGDKDEICNIETTKKFSSQFNCELEILKDSEHYFYKEEQLKKLAEDLEKFLENKLEIREIKRNEYHLLDEFLYKAIFIPENEIAPPREVTKFPELQVYIKDFGKFKDDVALVVEIDEKIIGMIWSRIMNDYGHIDEETPSLAMSITKEFQNKKIGTILLGKMLEKLKEKNYKKVSLSVQKNNYAVKLYKKAGFIPYKETEEEFIMLLKL
nr:GNAT family N-acetyltransferase [Fusobacterium sp.]